MPSHNADTPSDEPVGQDNTEGAGREAGSLPVGIRARARRLYRARRERLMEVPVAELRRRYGAAVDVDDEYWQHARVRIDDTTLEVGFAGSYRMFGALIDTQWVAATGAISTDDPHQRLTYRFDKRRFVVKRGADTDLADRMSNDRVARLVDAAELKAIEVLDDGANRHVVVTSLPGTITAVYFPPMPPYSTPIHPEEVAAQIDLALHLVRA